jgi:DNA-binding response OmpR family regulator
MRSSDDRLRQAPLSDDGQTEMRGDMPLTILLVEDNGDIAENICLYLENVGHTVDYAATGAQALALAEGQRYDALIVDIMLPGMDGLTLCKRLRDERNLETPVLMLTARDELGDKLEGSWR